METRPARSEAPSVGANASTPVRRWYVGQASGGLALEVVRSTQVDKEWAPHWHDEWAVGAVVSGQCRFSLGGAMHVASAGDVLAIAPGVVHTGALASADGGVPEVVMLYVCDSSLQHWALPRLAHSGLLHAPDLASGSLSVGSAEQARQWLAQVLTRLDSAPTPLQARSQPKGASGHKALQALQAMALSPQPVSVSALAETCGISREHFHRLVVRWLGISPQAYLRALRMTWARRLLLQGMPIVQVAQDCGFADQAHFTRWFGRSFGYTPGSLIQANQSAAAARPS